MDQIALRLGVNTLFIANNLENAKIHAQRWSNEKLTLALNISYDFRSTIEKKSYFSSTLYLNPMS